MSDFFENEKDIETQTDDLSAAENAADKSEPCETDEFSTIFSNPQEKRPYKPENAGKKKIFSLIAAVVAVAVLVSGTVAVIKLIPEKTEESTEQVSSSNDISVLSLDYTLFDKVTIANENGNFVFSGDRTTEKDDQGNETTKMAWTVDGFGSDKISSDLIDNIVSSLKEVSATREITEKSAEDCGILEPSRKIDIESEKYGNFSVLLGAASPDKTGVYLKLSNKDNIYLVNDDVATTFDFDYLDLANVSGFKGLDTTNLSAYLDADGAISTFDRLEISGENIEETLVFEPNSDEFLKAYIPYVVTSPIRQESDKLTDVLALFSTGLTSDGAYSFEINDEELKKVGLDNPDFIITIKLGSVNKTFKISAVDESYCAVIDNNSTMIEKVSIGSIPFINYTSNDFYSTWVFLRTIDYIKDITFEVDGEKYSFNITTSEDDETKTYKIKLGDKKITTEYFQDFYTQFISLQAADFVVGDSEQSPEMTVTVNYTDGHTEVIDFTRTAATKYQYRIDGRTVGRITSSSYNKVLKALKTVAKNKAVK